MPKPPFRYITLHIALATLAVVSYAGSLGYDFVWDDVEYVLQNPHITALSPEKLTWMATGFHSMNWHPLTWLSLAVDHFFHGLDAGGYRLVNILLHTANALGVFWLTLVVLRHTARRDLSLTAAGTAGLLFAVHPQHVEAVAWVTERKEVLCVFFLLPAMIAWLSYAAANTRIARRYWYSLSLICFALALLAKPMAVTLPAVLHVLDFYPLRRRLNRQLLVEKLPFWGLALMVITLTLVAQQQAMAPIPFVIRLLNAFNSIFFYLTQWLYPIHFSPFYPYSPNFSGLHAMLPMLGFGVISALCLWLYRKNHPYALAAWLFYLITLSPVLGIIQVGTQAAADRYAYLPTLVCYLFAGTGLALLLRHYPGRWWLQSLLSAGVLVLTVLTWQQISTWKNNVALWERATLYAPQSLFIRKNLGSAYLQAGDNRRAIHEFRRLIQQFPREAEVYYWLGGAYHGAHQFEEAVRTYRYLADQGLTPPRGMHAVYTELARAYVAQKNLPAARHALDQALALNPDDQRTYRLDALLRVIMGAR